MTRFVMLAAIFAVVAELPADAQTGSPAVTQADIKIARTLRSDALNGSRAYELVESLTTEVGPRFVGTPGYDAARDWAVARLTELGFENVRTEAFTAEGWLRGPESASVTAPFPQPLVITALGGSVATPEEGIEAEIVRFETLAALKRLPEAALDGKIAFLDQKLFPTQDGIGYGTVVPIRRDGASEAAKRGAHAVLIRSVGTDSHRMAHTGALSYAEGVQPIPAAALSNPDADQLARMLERNVPVTVRLILRPQRNGPVASENVIAEVPGSDRAEEIVLLAAHLDSWDLGTGAIDDGAGVAIVTAAAKMILDLPRDPRRTIRVVLYGAEEIGLVGARAYRRDHDDDIANHVIGVESDFGAGRVWRFDTRVGTAALGVMSDIYRELEPLGIAQGSNQARGGPDLLPLRFAGMPVAALYQDGRDYFDLHHTPDDTLDKVDAADLDQNVAAYAVFAWLAANADVDFRAAAPEPSAAD